jgi:hypothetical protein
MGPFGCLRGDNRIITEQGLLPISDLTQPMRVLSWNEKNNQFELSLSGDAFPKGEDYLYRVSTQQGEFVAAGHHHVLCEDRKYLPVENLYRGQILSLCSPSHLRKYVSANQLLSPEGDRHFLKIISNLKDHYAKSVRQYGQQLLKGVKTFESFFQELIDAQILYAPPCSGPYANMDGIMAPLLTHIHPDQFSDQKQIDDFFLRDVLQRRDVRDYILEQLSSHIWEKVQLSPQFLQKFLPRHIKKLSNLYCHSYSSSISERTILSVEKLPVKEVFWDVQVLNANNYVTEDGTIHHNSGKSSGCLMEIIRRAHEQKPSADGIRRTRWAIIRNTFRMLNDTTIRTVMDWLPESVFGEYSVTNHNYTITKMPGVHIELMFRALDRPEHVSNLLSMELTGAWVNEAREVPWEIIDAIDGRINRYPGKKDGGCTWCGIILDTNPPDENSEWYTYFEKKKPITAEIFKQPSGLSPQAENLPNLATGYYKTLAIGKNDQYVRVYIEGKYGYTQEGKVVIEQFNDNVHIALSIIQPIDGLPLVCGMDFALNPTLILGQITSRGKLLIVDEFVSDGMGLRRFCDTILIPGLRMNYFGMKIQGGYGDPSGNSRVQTDENTCYEILRDIGWSQIRPCPTNALLPRVAAVENLLTKMIDGEPALVISPKCIMLRKALNGGYHRQKISGTINEYSDQPFKNIYSHPAEALEYLCYYVNDMKGKKAKEAEIMKRIGPQRKKQPATMAGY